MPPDGGRRGRSRSRLTEHYFELTVIVSMWKGLLVTIMLVLRHGQKNDPPGYFEEQVGTPAICPGPAVR